MTISSKQIMGISGSKFGKVNVGGGKTFDKKEFAKMAYGGATSSSLNEKMKRAGVPDYMRSRYLKAVEGKKEIEPKKSLRPGMIQRDMSNSDLVEYKKQKYKFGGFSKDKILGGVGEGVKGSSTDLKANSGIKKSFFGIKF